MMRVGSQVRLTAEAQESYANVGDRVLTVKALSQSAHNTPFYVFVGDPEGMAWQCLRVTDVEEVQPPSLIVPEAPGEHSPAPFSVHWSTRLLQAFRQRTGRAARTANPRL